MVASMINKPYMGFPPKTDLFPSNIKAEAPKKPIMTPASWILVNFSRKINIPNTNVQIGVRLLSNPATELLNWVWAKEKRKAGIPLPVNPIAKNLTH